MNLNDSDDDSDYELPSLSERVQAAFKAEQTLQLNMTSDSEGEENKFLKFAEQIRTPLSEIKCKLILTSDSENEESEFLKFSEKNYTPHSEIKFKLNLTSDSENDESEFLKFVEKEKIHTPCSNIKPKFNLATDSENEELEFLKFSEKIRTPYSSIKKNYHDENDEDSDEIFSNLTKTFSEMHTPLAQNNLLHNITSDSECEDSKILKFSQKIRNTLRSEINGKYCKENESNNKESIFNSARKPHKSRKPMYKTKENYCEVNESDSDDSFYTPLKLPKFRTPKSDIRSIKKDFVPLSSVSEKLNSADSCPKGDNKTDDEQSSLKVSYSETEKEYAALFPSITVNSSFLKNKALYSRKLYEFFNRKIFNYQLPGDMPLIWDGSLLTTAGLTYCRQDKGIYSCSIKLSKKLLTSFDRLQNTLLHEMCHAAVWIINKQVNVRHGPLWKIWASRCKLILPFVDCPKRCHNYDVPYRVWYKCTSCNWKVGRCKQSKKYQKAVCGICKAPLIVTKEE